MATYFGKVGSVWRAVRRASRLAMPGRVVLERLAEPHYLVVVDRGRAAQLFAVESMCLQRQSARSPSWAAACGS
ncbi:hypothetical protein [Streptomyces sp. NPDC090131]|uniref:hypothetical protein n=1 Tax=Streptomyces sp. NPDC090131 TaxID=3365954 RepID=UPI0038221626